MHFRPFNVSILIIVLLLSLRSFGQELLVTNYDIDDGLSQNSVYSSVVSDDGFIWIATQDGLNRFDGKSFKTFRSDGNTNYSEYSKFITHLFIDKRKHFFVATSSNIVLFNKNKNEFNDPQSIYPNLKLPKDTWIQKIIETNDEKLWFLSSSNILYNYDIREKEMVEFKLPDLISDINLDNDGTLLLSSKYKILSVENKKNSLLYSSDQNSEILKFEVVQNKIWIITANNQLVEFDRSKKTSLDLRKAYNLTSFNDPRVIHYSNDGNVWIGSRSNGIIKISLQNKSVKSLELNSSGNNISRSFILSINSGKGFTLVGQSGAGLTIVNNALNGFLTYRCTNSKKNELIDNMIHSLNALDDDIIYAGTLIGGLLEYNTKTLNYKYYLPPFSESLRPEAKNIYSIIRIGNDLWMASWGGLLKFNLFTKKFELFEDDKDGRTKKLTALIKLKNQNKLILSGYNGGLLMFDLSKNKFEECPDVDGLLTKHKVRVRYLKEFANGDIFMSSENKSFFKYNINTGKVNFYQEIENYCGISRHFCFVGEGRSQKCYIATDRGIVVTDNEKFNIIKTITTKEGLPNNIIYAIQNDNEGKLWVSSNIGISRINPESLNILNFTEKQGIQGLEFNTASVFLDKRSIYFGGTSGFTKVEPENIGFEFNTQIPIINEIMVMNQPFQSQMEVSLIDTIILKYNKNFITLGFQSLYNNFNKNSTYRYSLSGIDEGWVSIANRNYVSYSNLQPGTYNFNVCSYNINDTWSNPRILTIIIQHAWYQAWWFKLLMFLGIGSSIYMIARWRFKEMKFQSEKEKDYLLKISKLELDNLRSQMNPHFMFNALNSINKFIIENDTRRASDYLTKFSRLMRMILDHSRQAVIPVSNEIEALQLYLLVESNRFSNKFTYNININPDVNINNILIPPLIIQPYVENAIWHGLAHRNENGIIDINIESFKDKFLKISIIDNGIGRKNASKLNSKSSINKKSYGMDITLNRIRHVSEENDVIIEDLVDENGKPLGTKVVLILNTVI